MQIGAPFETHADKMQVSATSETVKKLIGQGHQAIVQSGAGVSASQPDSAYEAVGATIGSAAEVFGADLVLKVVASSAAELAQMKNGAASVGMLNSFGNENIVHMAERGITAFALEVTLRTSRAQSLDVLSLQVNIAGCKVVMLAINHYPRFMPMLMTAAGTVKVAHVLILGASVAGPQAIATARRPGVVIKASDVHPAVREQVESFGAKFIDMLHETDKERERAEGVGGYARSMSASWIKHQTKAVYKRAKQLDIVITTAPIPGRKVPVLLHEATVARMKSGSVAIDLATVQGGNCPLAGVDQVVVRHGVTIVGHSNLAALVSADVLALYARNILDFPKLTLNAGGFSVNLEDDIAAVCLMCRGGQAVRKNG